MKSIDGFLDMGTMSCIRISNYHALVPSHTLAMSDGGSVSWRVVDADEADGEALAKFFCMIDPLSKA